MKKISLSIALLLLALNSCKKKPFIPLPHIGGYVIGKENCSADVTDDYWLIDFTYYPNQPQIGDTLLLNGIIYTNVLKVKGLDERLQQIGMAVSFDYKGVSPTTVITTGCTVDPPVTYPLKELFIINQGEIR